MWKNGYYRAAQHLFCFILSASQSVLPQVILHTKLQVSLEKVTPVTPCKTNGDQRLIRFLRNDTSSLDPQIFINIQPMHIIYIYIYMYMSKTLPLIHSNLDLNTLQYTHVHQRLIPVMICAY